MDQSALNHCLGSAEILVLNNCQPYFYSVLETNSSMSQPSAGHQNFIQANLYSTHCNIIFKYLKSSLKKDINDNKPFRLQIKSLNRVINVHFSNDPISFDSIKLCNNRIDYSSQIPRQLLITLRRFIMTEREKFCKHFMSRFQFPSVEISISFSGQDLM